MARTKRKLTPSFSDNGRSDGCGRWQSGRKARHATSYMEEDCTTHAVGRLDRAREVQSRRTQRKSKILLVERIVHWETGWKAERVAKGAWTCPLDVKDADDETHPCKVGERILRSCKGNGGAWPLRWDTSRSRHCMHRSGPRKKNARCYCSNTRLERRNISTPTILC